MATPRKLTSTTLAPVTLTTSVSPGTLIYTATTSSTEIDQVAIFISNTSTTAYDVGVCVGSTVLALGSVSAKNKQETFCVCLVGNGVAIKGYCSNITKIRAVPDINRLLKG